MARELLRVQKEHVGSRGMGSGVKDHPRCFEPFGVVQKCDVGKIVYVSTTMDGRHHYSVENENERQERVARWKEKGIASYGKYEVEKICKSIDLLEEAIKKQLVTMGSLRDSLSCYTEYDDDATCFRLARKFARQLKRDIGRKDFAEVVRRNQTSEYSKACASHDFCDANMVMYRVGQEMFGPAFDSEDEVSLTRWNRAWDIAKEHKFFSGEPEKEELGSTVDSMTEALS